MQSDGIDYENQNLARLWQRLIQDRVLPLCFASFTNLKNNDSALRKA